jgi:hypothetical protein
VFLADGNEWTSDSRLAHDFADGVEASKLVRAKHLSNVELYFAFEAPLSSWDFSVPLDPH